MVAIQKIKDPMRRRNNDRGYNNQESVRQYSDVGDPGAKMNCFFEKKLRYGESNPGLLGESELC